jgi:hypothetical protein
MWAIDDIEIREVQLDFTSSEGGRPSTTAVYANDTCLVNALGYVELTADPTQLIVCEACGRVCCEPGGWVHLRRIAESVAFTPAFTEMLDSDFESTEYSPPTYLSTTGVPLFSPVSYTILRSAVPAFPEIEAIKPLTAAEAVRLIQWQAPLRVLGRFPEVPQISRRAILAVTDGQLDEHCDRLQQFIDNHVDSTVVLTAVDQSGILPVEFHLNGPGYPSWCPIASRGNDIVFNIEPVGQLTLSHIK